MFLLPSILVLIAIFILSFPELGLAATFNTCFSLLLGGNMWNVRNYVGVFHVSLSIVFNILTAQINHASDPGT